MSTETVFPWHSAIQELALMQSRQEWAAALEYLGGQMAGAQRCHFFVGSDPHWLRPATGERCQASDSSLLGAAWMNAEAVHRETRAGELYAGVAALEPCWALPLRSFGRVIGLITLEKVEHPPELTTWNAMLDLMALSWGNVCDNEDEAAYQQATEQLLLNALAALPSQRPGHVQRVVQTASELGRLLDLSAHQRQRLARAATYHDVGLLVSATEHARAGAEYLRQGRLLGDLASLVEHHHTPYNADLGLGLEEWTLALAEHFQEFCESHLGEDPDKLVHRFSHQHAARHNPAVLDALVGLSVSGKLESLLPQ